MGIRMSEEEEQAGADLSIHKIAARPEAVFPDSADAIIIGLRKRHFKSRFDRHAIDAVM